MVSYFPSSHPCHLGQCGYSIFLIIICEFENLEGSLSDEKKRNMEDVFAEFLLFSKKLLNILCILGAAIIASLQAWHRGCNITFGLFHLGCSVKDECFGNREPQKVNPKIKLQKGVEKMKMTLT